MEEQNPGPISPGFINAPFIPAPISAPPWPYGNWRPLAFEPCPSDAPELVKAWWLLVFQFAAELRLEIAEDLEAFQAPFAEKMRAPVMHPESECQPKSIDYGSILAKYRK